MVTRPPAGEEARGVVPAGRGGILSGTSVAAHRPAHSDICVCASVGCLSSFPGGEPSVAPWEAAARAF